MPLINNQPLSEYTGLTGTVIIYPHIEALYETTGIRYVTMENSCCGTLKVAAENHSSRILSSSSSVW